MLHLSLIRWTLLTTWQINPRLSIGYFGSAIVHGGLPIAQIVISRFLINDIVSILGDGEALIFPISSWLIILFGITLIDTIALLVGTRYIPKRIEDELSLYITSLIMAHANKLPLKLFEDLKFQDTLERAQQQMALNYIIFLRSFVDASIGVIQVVLLFAILIYIEPLMVAIVILALPPYSAIMWMISQRRYKNEFRRAPARRWTRYFTELMLQKNNATEIRVLGIGHFIIERFQVFLRNFAEENAKIEARATVASVIFVTVTLSMFYILFYQIIGKVLSGSLTVGDIAITVGAITRLSSVSEQIVSKFGLTLERSMYVDNLRTYLAIPTKNKDSSKNQIQQLQGRIEFRDISFTYANSEREILSGVSFTINRGETVAIVGENGAGKSTIVKLIAQIYEPTSGSIWLDNYNLNNLSTESIHQQIAFIMQDFARYEATVADNIAYGNIEEYLNQSDKIKQLAQKLDIHDMIQSMPDNYDTLLGRRFGTYEPSGGQWQQLAIARAFTRDTPILILDEPTSSLDVRAEHRIFSRFAELSKQRTTLIISHRFTTVSMADRILVLSRGQIAEQGTHDELMQKSDGIYAQLYYLHNEKL